MHLFNHFFHLFKAHDSSAVTDIFVLLKIFSMMERLYKLIQRYLLMYIMLRMVTKKSIWHLVPQKTLLLKVLGCKFKNPQKSLTTICGKSTVWMLYIQCRSLWAVQPPWILFKHCETLIQVFLASFLEAVISELIKSVDIWNIIFQKGY